MRVLRARVQRRPSIDLPLEREIDSAIVLGLILGEPERGIGEAEALLVEETQPYSALRAIDEQRNVESLLQVQEISARAFQIVDRKNLSRGARAADLVAQE